MKRIFCAFGLLMALVACGKIDTEITKETPKYVGSVIVENDGPQTFGNVGVQVAFDDASGVMEMKILKVRFASMMPRMDVTIQSVPFVRSVENGVETVAFSGDNIIPFAVGAYQSKYIVTDLEGSIVGNRMEFSLNFGQYPTVYSGVM